MTAGSRQAGGIHKKDADTDEPVEGVVFLVKAADGHSLAEVTTNSQGVAVVENLLPQVVEVSEKSVPSPYLLDAPSQLVTLFANHDRDVYFENHKAPVVTIRKENSVTHDPISNVRFHITWASNKSADGEIRDLGTLRTDEDGKIEIQVEDGWLKIQELDCPGFQVKGSDTQEGFVKAGEAKTFLFENTPLSAIVIWKYDTVTGAPVEGATFAVKYLSGTTGTGGTVVDTVRTSRNGSATIPSCKAGTYVIEELSSDSGHVIDTAPQTVYLSGEPQEVVTVSFGNSPKGNLLVKKVSAADGTPISDTEFLVTTNTGALVGTANGRFKTAHDGTFLVEGMDPGTVLVVRETRARQGFLLDDTAQVATIQAGRTVELEFRNQPLGNLIIRKLDGSDRKTPLEGVRFKITYADGSFVDADGGKRSSNGLYYTDKDGLITLSGITGTVVVTEEATIDGYTIGENSTQTVVVNPDDTQTLTFYNSPIGGVELIKVNENDRSERIPNTTFEIRRLDGGLVSTVTTDKNGRVFASLEDGGYYAVETAAAKNFKLDDTPIYFEVKGGRTTTLTVTNKALSGILIHKIDATTGKGIYGVRFMAYDSKHNPIAEVVTDQNGSLINGGLGYGGIGGNCNWGGGGGGYYGGGSGTGNSFGGGGGSGYIGSSSLVSAKGVTKQMYMHSTGCSSSTAATTKTTCTISKCACLSCANSVWITVSTIINITTCIIVAPNINAISTGRLSPSSTIAIVTSAIRPTSAGITATISTESIAHATSATSCENYYIGI